MELIVGIISGLIVALILSALALLRNRLRPIRRLFMWIMNSRLRFWIEVSIDFPEGTPFPSLEAVQTKMEALGKVNHVLLVRPNAIQITYEDVQNPILVELRDAPEGDESDLEIKKRMNIRLMGWIEARFRGGYAVIALDRVEQTVGSITEMIQRKGNQIIVSRAELMDARPGWTGFKTIDEDDATVCLQDRTVSLTTSSYSNLWRNIQKYLASPI